MSQNIDECEHPGDSWKTEVVEVDTMRNGEHDTYEQEVYVCGICDATIEDADPATDRADNLADIEYENYRDSQL